MLPVHEQEPAPRPISLLLRDDYLASSVTPPDTPPFRADQEHSTLPAQRQTGAPPGLAIDQPQPAARPIRTGTLALKCDTSHRQRDAADFGGVGQLKRST